MYIHIYVYIYVYNFIRTKHKHTGRRLLGNALTTSATTLRSLRGPRVVTKTSTKAPPSTSIRNHHIRGGRRETTLNENIRVVVSVKARGIAAADVIVDRMTTDNINKELAKVGLPAASVLVYAHSAGELLLARFAHRLLHVLIGHNIHT